MHKLVHFTCCLFFLCQCFDGGGINPITSTDISNELTCYDFSEIQSLKKAIRDGKYERAYKNLISNADHALSEGPFSVIQKTTLPPSGDKRDYYSIGPYWWPDPEKEDGLPWIRRDGEINPMNRGVHVDYERKNEFLNSIENLSWAYYFSGSKIYAKKLKDLLEFWFVNESTRMNPSLNFAQGIPGRNTGRGIGIIEWTGITRVITAIEILELEKQLFDDESLRLRHWFIEFKDWLEYSEYGQDERAKKNNHGTWYDVIFVSISMFLGQDEDAKEYLEATTTRRIESQIDAQGKQPHELERTKALSYSIMNLHGFLKLCYFAERLDVDLWGYEGTSGGSIQKALEYLEPFTAEDVPWPYQQIISLPETRHKLKSLIHDARKQFGYPTVLAPSDSNPEASIFSLIN